MLQKIHFALQLNETLSHGNEALFMVSVRSISFPHAASLSDLAALTINGSSCRQSNSVPLVNDDPYPSPFLISSLAVLVATRRVVLVNVLSV